MKMALRKNWREREGIVSPFDFLWFFSTYGFFVYFRIYTKVYQFKKGR